MPTLRRQTERKKAMNVYKLLFIFLFLWSSIYTVSVSVYNFKSRNIYCGINAVIFQIISSVLSVLYILK